MTAAYVGGEYCEASFFYCSCSKWCPFWTTKGCLIKRMKQKRESKKRERKEKCK